MENLSASMDEGLILTSKPRELETVSRGIQQLRMDDSTWAQKVYHSCDTR